MKAKCLSKDPGRHCPMTHPVLLSHEMPSEAAPRNVQNEAPIRPGMNPASVSQKLSLR